MSSPDPRWPGLEWRTGASGRRRAAIAGRRIYVHQIVSLRETIQAPRESTPSVSTTIDAPPELAVAVMIAIGMTYEALRADPRPVDVVIADALSVDVCAVAHALAYAAEHPAQIARDRQAEIDALRRLQDGS